MKQILLTSSPFTEPGFPLNDKNHFVQRLTEALPARPRAVMITSNPADEIFTEEFSSAIRNTMELTGIRFGAYCVLDGRNKDRTEELVRSSDLIILAGGHVPTQNAFFEEIGLKAYIQDFEGTVFGISAGSMNSSDIVYAQPEEKGEAVDPEYKRFLHGLDLTKIMLLPHYNGIKDQSLDGKKIIEEITFPDSFGKQFIAICDGSYLYSDGITERICGEAYLIKDGILKQICKDREEFILPV